MKAPRISRRAEFGKGNGTLKLIGELRSSIATKWPPNVGKRNIYIYDYMFIFKILYRQTHVQKHSWRGFPCLSAWCHLYGGKCPSRASRS